MAWIIFQIILILLLISLAYASVSGAPWVPTWKRDIERFLKVAEFKKGEVLYELGCGDARLVVAAAKKHGVKGVGVELSFLQVIIAWIRVLLTQADVKILWKNAFNVDVSKADVIYLFLMPETNRKMKIKLEQEMKSGARVVSYVWPIEGWEPIRVDRDARALTLYVYQR